MNTDVADLLHESIDRLTEGERVPPGLADRAFHCHRQRSIALRAAVATGTALAAAGVAVTVVTSTAVTVPGGAARSTVPRVTARDASYVFRQTERALTMAERENLVEEIHTVGHHYGLGLTQVSTVHFNAGGTGTVIRQAGPTAAQEMIWSYRGQLREQGLDAAGRPVFDATGTTARSPAGPKSVLMRVSGTGIDFRAKTWWHAAVRLRLPASAHPAACTSAYLPPPVGSTVDWPAVIRTALSCGHYRIAGQQQLGTARAIKLISVKPDGPYSETLWVSPATYLPMRLTWHWLDQRGAGPGTLTGDFRWLRPTAANLANLRVTVPHGFRQEHSGGLPVPGMSF
jgi:hypothetical protein